MAGTEEIKALLSNLSVTMQKNHSDLSMKIDSLQTTTDNLNLRINEVSKSISADIKNLEDRTFTEIHNLQSHQETLHKQIDANKESTDESLGILKSLILIQRQDIDRKSEELNEAVRLLKTQSDRLTELEKSCHGGSQHNRGWNVEFDGIPVNVGDDPHQLEKSVIEICNKINVPITEYHIDTVHRLPSQRSPKTTIVRFHSRKVVREIHDNKRKLKDIEELDLDIPGLNADSKIYISASQSPYIKTLAYNCRLLKRSNLIAQVITGKDGRLTIRTLDGDYVKVGHEEDLTSKFPDFRRFSFDVREPSE